MEGHPPGKAPGARLMTEHWAMGRLGWASQIPGAYHFFLDLLLSSLRSPGVSAVLRSLRTLGKEAEQGEGGLGSSWPQSPHQRSGVMARFYLVFTPQDSEPLNFRVRVSVF